MPESISFGPGKVSAPTVSILVLLAHVAPAAEEARTAQSVAVVAAPVQGRTVRLEEYLQSYEQALTNRQYVEAETAAKQIIDEMFERGARDGSPMADALSRLAYAQRMSERYDASIQNYDAAIVILEATGNRLNDQLIEPLLGMGDTYLASGRADLALPVYGQALHIRHVNDGPHTLDQVGIIDGMVTAAMQNGDPDAALDLTDRMYYLYARAFAADSEEVLPALQRKADLLNEIGRHRQERMVYREIVRIIEDRRGESDLSLLDKYTAMGHTYFYDLDEVFYRSEPTTDTGETFLKKALAIAEDNPDATWLMQEQALIELGDYYTVRDIQDKARIHFRRAWKLASSDPDRLDRRAEDLERIVPLIQNELDPYANFGYRSADDDADPEDYMNGYVVASFTVTDRGHVTDVAIVDADPQGFAPMETRVKQAVRDFVYRPRYRDGEPVHTRNSEFRHDYLYLESDLVGE